MRQGDQTPWGPAQACDKIGCNVWIVETASHGGVRMAGTAADAIPAAVAQTFINGREWAEEDCELPIALMFLMAAGQIDETRLNALYPTTTMDRMWELAHYSAKKYDSYKTAIKPLHSAERRWRASRPPRERTSAA